MLSAIRAGQRAVATWVLLHPSATRVVAVLVVMLFVAGPGVVQATDLEDMATDVEQVGKRWALPAAVLVALCAAGAIALGSDNAGRVVGRSLVALVFLVLAMLGGRAIQSFMDPVLN